MGKCRHFLEGKCTYGDKCKFDHIEAVEGSKEWRDEVKWEKKRTRRRVDTFIGEMRDRIKARMALEGKPTMGVAEALAELALAGNEVPENGAFCNVLLPGMKTQLCRDFLCGCCILGFNCLMAHGLEELVAPPDEPLPIVEEQPKYNVIEEDSLGKWIEVDSETLERLASSKEAFRFKTSLCRLNDMGACPKGDGCVFAHGQSELQLPGQTAKQMRRLHAIPESWYIRNERQMEYEKRVSGRVRREPTRASICKHFELGQCRHGKSCKFSHGLEEMDVAKRNELMAAQTAEIENAAKAAQTEEEEQAAFEAQAVAQAMSTLQEAVAASMLQAQAPSALGLLGLQGLPDLSGLQQGLAAMQGLQGLIMQPGLAAMQGLQPQGVIPAASSLFDPNALSMPPPPKMPRFV